MKPHLIPLLLFASIAVAATDPARFAAAQALYDEKKFPEAEAAFKKLAAADPTNAEVQCHYGLALGRRGDFDAATETLEKAVKLAPANARYHFNLGDAYGQAAQKAGVLSKFGLAKKCLAGFQRAAELEPANVDYHAALFEYYRQAPGIAGGGFEKAEAEAAAILKLDPVRGNFSYATLYAGEKKFDLARKHALEVKRLDATRGRSALINIYIQTKEYDLVLAEFEDALKAKPDDYGALYQLGRFSATSGQALDRGLAALRQCLDFTPATDQPGHAAAHWRIGNILERQNNIAGARAAYQAALELDPKFTNAADSLKKLK